METDVEYDHGSCSEVDRFSAATDVEEEEDGILSSGSESTGAPDEDSVNRSRIPRC